MFNLCKIGIHNFEHNVETVTLNFPPDHYLKQIDSNIRTRFCYKCGIKQRKHFRSKKWIEMKLNISEYREHNLNILLKSVKDGRNK